MSRRRFIVLLLVASLVICVVASPVLAQDQGGIEGAIQGFAEQYGTLGAVAVLAAGVVLLTISVEKLISYLVRSALGLGISLFALAIVFTGIEFDDTAVAFVFSSSELQNVALGSALGTGLAIIGVTLAVAAIFQPFSVEIPRDYLVVFVVSPLLLIPFVLKGTLTFGDGLVLIALFAVLFGYIIVREYQRDLPVFRSSEISEAIRTDGGATASADSDVASAFPDQVSPIFEDRLVGNRSELLWLGFAIVALVGIVLASILLESGSEVVIEDFGIDGTVFGATVLTLILTFEDIMLTLEPVRRGYPEIGIGNVIGSVVFSMTANVGVILLFGSLDIAPSVASFHLPAIIVVTALAGYFLYRGELKRWHGYLLGGCYVAYWVIALVVFGGVPISG